MSTTAHRVSGDLYIMNKELNSARLSTQQLTDAGKLLYGNQWQTDMANALGIDARRVRDWLQERRPIPIGITWEVIDLLKDKSKKTQEMSAELFDSSKELDVP